MFNKNKLVIISILMLISFSKLVGQDVFFEIPKDVLNIENLPYANDSQKRSEYIQEKLIYRLTIEPISTLKNKRPYLLSDSLRVEISSNQELTEQDVLNLLNKDSLFILTNYNSMSDITDSYKHIMLDNKIIGESYFSTGADGLIVVGSFVYTLKIVANDSIYTFWMNFSIVNDFNVLKKLPDIFIYRDNKWYWVSEDSSTILYERIVKKDPSLPTIFIELQNSWDEFIDTLSINETKIVIK